MTMDTKQPPYGQSLNSAATQYSLSMPTVPATANPYASYPQGMHLESKTFEGRILAVYQSVIFAAIERPLSQIGQLLPTVRYSGGNTIRMKKNEWFPLSPDRVPELGVVRSGVQSFSEWEVTTARYGVGIRFEHGFSKTAEGQQNLLDKVTQVLIGMTNHHDLEVLYNLLWVATASNRPYLRLLNLTDPNKSLVSLLQREATEFAVLQKDRFTFGRLQAQMLSRGSAMGVKLNTIIVPQSLMDAYKWQHVDDMLYNVVGTKGPNMLTSPYSNPIQNESVMRIIPMPLLPRQDGVTNFDPLRATRTLGESFRFRINDVKEYFDTKDGLPALRIKIHNYEDNRLSTIDQVTALKYSGLFETDDTHGSLRPLGVGFFSDFKSFEDYLRKNEIFELFDPFITAHATALLERLARFNVMNDPRDASTTHAYECDLKSADNRNSLSLLRDFIRTYSTVEMLCPGLIAGLMELFFGTGPTDAKIAEDLNAFLANLHEALAELQERRAELTARPKLSIDDKDGQSFLCLRTPDEDSTATVTDALFPNNNAPVVDGMTANQLDHIVALTPEDINFANNVHAAAFDVRDRVRDPPLYMQRFVVKSLIDPTNLTGAAKGLLEMKGRAHFDASRALRTFMQYDMTTTTQPLMLLAAIVRAVTPGSRAVPEAAGALADRKSLLEASPMHFTFQFFKYFADHNHAIPIDFLLARNVNIDTHNIIALDSNDLGNYFVQEPDWLGGMDAHRKFGLIAITWNDGVAIKNPDQVMLFHNVRALGYNEMYGGGGVRCYSDIEDQKAVSDGLIIGKDIFVMAIRPREEVPDIYDLTGAFPTSLMSATGTNARVSRALHYSSAAAYTALWQWKQRDYYSCASFRQTATTNTKMFQVTQIYTRLARPTPHAPNVQLEKTITGCGHWGNGPIADGMNTVYFGESTHPIPQAYDVWSRSV